MSEKEMGIEEKYRKAAERLWEKLEYHRDEFDLENILSKDGLPADVFASKNKLFYKLLNEVNNEFDADMTVFQCSWAVVQMIDGGYEMMKKYNEHNDRNLKPRR